MTNARTKKCILFPSKTMMFHCVRMLFDSFLSCVPFVFQFFFFKFNHGKRHIIKLNMLTILRCMVYCHYVHLHYIIIATTCSRILYQNIGLLNTESMPYLFPSSADNFRSTLVSMSLITLGPYVSGVIQYLAFIDYLDSFSIMPLRYICVELGRWQL